MYHHGTRRASPSTVQRVNAHAAYRVGAAVPIKTIVVGLDGSPRADGVLGYAESLAGVTGARLVLVQVAGIPPEMELAWPLSDRPLESAIRGQARAYLEACARRLPPELLGGVRVAQGVPWQALCAVASDENANLIVIGSHGYGALDHLTGTTAAKVVNHADRPVLVVRPVPGAP